ncbi:hypothetical protein AN641_04700 [Candidatus Epulonipiscioides gigas]|nr:hypothetical protein AN641_04700 [Epulopiscium sp. SCG-C07WGA-EpuloA2]
MNLKEKYFYGKDGTELFYLTDIPKNAKGIVIIAHGYMEHSGRYIEFANLLVTDGFGVCIIDHRGNGRSKGARGDIDDFFIFTNDIKILISSLQKYNKPIYTYGHSMGGLIMFLYGLKYKNDLNGQIFSCPALVEPKFCHYFPRGFYQMMGTNFPMYKIKRGGINVAVKCPEFKKVFKKDMLVNKNSTARFFDQFLRKGIQYAASNAINYDLKSLFLLAENDYVIPLEDNEKIIDNIPNINKTKKIYNKCMHDLLHDDNENVKIITQDILKWLNNNLSKKSKNSPASIGSEMNSSRQTHE